MGFPERIDTILNRIELLLSFVSFSDVLFSVSTASNETDAVP